MRQRYKDCAIESQRDELALIWDTAFELGVEEGWEDGWDVGWEDGYREGEENAST